jgi:O-antigen/teichoic acid export membrane protein
MFRNIFWMGLSSAVRLGTGLILFVLIARRLGSEEFGHYMFWYSVTYLSALIANYGLSNMLLKEIAQHTERVTLILSESLSLRIMLSVSIFLCALGISIIVDRPELLLILLLAHLVENISETLYVVYRALGYFARESQLAACAAIAQLTLVIIAVITNQNAGVIASAHLAGKVVQLVLILPISKRTFGRFSLQSAYTAFKLAIRSKAYAIDNILTSAFGNIDSVVLRALAGVDTVGIYQSGMRIFQGGIQVAPILSNVFLPEMARQALCQGKDPRIAIVLQTSFLTYGAIFGLILAYFSDQIVSLAFGESYGQLAALLPLFGLLFFLRFFVASWGVILTATGHQAYRAKSTAIHLVFMLFAGSYLAYGMQAQGWLIAAILANVLLGILLMVRTIRIGLKTSSVSSIIIAIFWGMFFVPLLFWR